MTPQYDLALADILGGMARWRMWGRLGWAEIRGRYRRTAIGPFWTTLSLAIFIFAIGTLWSVLLNVDMATYLPFVSAGLIAWGLVSTIISESCVTFSGAEQLIKALKFPYTVLTCSVVWRNVLVFAHNLLVFVPVAIFADVHVGWATLLIIPGLIVICINGLWIGTLLGLICARFRDVQQIIIGLLQIALFVTPVFWSADILTQRVAKLHLATLVDFNILYHFVDLIRSPLLGKAPAQWSWIMVAMSTVLGWGFTLFVYSRFRRRIPYWI